MKPGYLRGTCVKTRGDKIAVFLIVSSCVRVMLRVFHFLDFVPTSMIHSHPL